MSLDHKAACAVAAKLTSEFKLMNYSEDAKIKATAKVFDELHQWATEKLPMGASAQVTEETLRNGLKAVRNKLQHADQNQFEQANGFPLLLVLGLIPTLVSWIKMLWTFWNSNDKQKD